MPTSYANLGGTGDRWPWIIPTVVGIPFGAGSAKDLIVNGATSTMWWQSTALSAATYVLFDFRLFGGAVVIDEAKWYQDVNTSQGVWQWQGSQDNVSWTNIGATFTLGGATPFQTQSTLNGNTTAYAYYRMLGVSGSSSSSPFDQEIEFKISGAAYSAIAAQKTKAQELPGFTGAMHQLVKGVPHSAGGGGSGIF